MHWNQFNCSIWVRSRRFACLVTWFCYHLIAKPGNKTGEPPWPDAYVVNTCMHVYWPMRNYVSNYPGKHKFGLCALCSVNKLTWWICGSTKIQSFDLKAQNTRYIAKSVLTQALSQQGDSNLLGPHIHTFPQIYVHIMYYQSCTKPNLVAKKWLPNLVTILHRLPKLVANISSQFRHRARCQFFCQMATN